MQGRGPRCAADSNELDLAATPATRAHHSSRSSRSAANRRAPSAAPPGGPPAFAFEDDRVAGRPRAPRPRAARKGPTAAATAIIRRARIRPPPGRRSARPAAFQVLARFRRGGAHWPRLAEPRRTTASPRRGTPAAAPSLPRAGHARPRCQAHALVDCAVDADYVGDLAQWPLPSAVGVLYPRPRPQGGRDELRPVGATLAGRRPGRGSACRGPAAGTDARRQTARAGHPGARERLLDDVGGVAGPGTPHGSRIVRTRTSWSGDGAGWIQPVSGRRCGLRPASRSRSGCTTARRRRRGLRAALWTAGARRRRGPRRDAPLRPRAGRAAPGALEPRRDRGAGRRAGARRLPRRAPGRGRAGPVAAAAGHGRRLAGTDRGSRGRGG